MKKIKKIIAVYLELLLIILVVMLAFNFNAKSNTSKAASSGSTNTTYSCYFTSDLFVAEDYSNVITSANPGETIFMTMVLNVPNGIDSYQINYDISDYVTAGYKFTWYTNLSATLNGGYYMNLTAGTDYLYDYIGGDSCDTDSYYTLAIYESLFAGEEYYKEGRNSYYYVSDMSEVYGRTGTNYIEGQWTNGLSSQGFIENSYLTSTDLFIGGYSSSNCAAGTYIMAKIQIDIPSSATESGLSLTTNSVAFSGTDGTYSSTGSDSTYDLNSVTYGSTSYSSSVDTVATITGDADSTSSTVNFSTSSTTGTAKVSNDSTSATIAVSVDSGKGALTSATIDGTSTTVSNNSITASNLVAGTPVTIVLNVKAQDGETSATYTLTLTRKYCTTAELTNLTFAANDNNYTSLSSAFATATKSYTLTYSSLATSIDVTPTWDTSTNATVTVNGTTATSGSAITISSLSDGAKIKVVVTPEDPDTSAVTYTITLDEFTEDLSVTSVKVYDASSTLLTTLTSTSTDSTTGYTYYTYEVDYETAKTAVYYVVVLSDSTNNGVTYSPTGSSQSGNIYSESGTFPYGKDTYYIPFVVTNDVTGNSNTLYLLLTRAEGNEDTSIGDITISDYNGGTYGVNGSGTSSDPYINDSDIDYLVTGGIVNVTAGNSYQTATYQYSTTSFTSGLNSSTTYSFGSDLAKAFASTTDATSIYIVLTITPQVTTATPGVIYIQISREAADTTATFDNSSFYVQNLTDTTNLSLQLMTSYGDKGYTAASSDGDMFTYAEFDSGVYIYLPYQGAGVDVTITDGYIGSSASATSGSTTASVSSPTTLSGTLKYYVLFTDYSITEMSIQFLIKAEAGNTFDLRFFFEREAADTDTSITVTVTGTVDGVVYTNSTTFPTYRYIIDKETALGEQTTFELSAVATSSYAEIQYSTDGSTWLPTSDATQSIEFTGNIATIYYLLVTPQGGLSQQYNIITSYSDQRSTNAEIAAAASDQLGKYSYVKTTSTQTSQTVAYNVGTIYMNFVMSDSDAYGVSVNGTKYAATDGSISNVKITLTVGSNTIEFYGIAENTDVVSTLTYKLEVVRSSASTDNFITSYLETYSSASGLISGQSNTDYETSNTIYVNLTREGGVYYSIEFTISDLASYSISTTSSSTTGDTSGTYISDSTTLSYKISDLTAGSYKIIYITVYSEKSMYDGTTSSDYNKYTIYVARAQEEATASDIDIYSDSSLKTEMVDTSGATYSYTGNATSSNPDTMTVAYAQASTAYFKVTFDSSTSYYATNGSSTYLTLTQGTANAMTFTFYSEYYIMRHNTWGDTTYTDCVEYYYITITRVAGDTDNTLATFVAYVGDSSTGTLVVDSSTIIDATDVTTPRYTWNGNTIKLEYIGNTASIVTVMVTATSDLASFVVDSSSSMTNDTTEYVAITCATGYTSYSKTIIVTPEYGSQNSYTIQIAREAVDLSSDCSFASVVATYDSTSNDTVTSGKTITLIYTSSGATIVATAGSTVATVYIYIYESDGTTAVDSTSATYKATYTNALPTAGSSYIVRVKIEAQDGTSNEDSGSTFKFTITRTAASTSTTITEITVVNTTTAETVTIANPSSGAANASVASMSYGTTEVEITLTTTDTTVTVPASATYDGLHIGMNSAFTFKVTAQSKDTATYYVKVFVYGDVSKDSDVDYTLSVEDSTTFSPTFYKISQTTYTATMAYGTDNANTLLTFTSSTWNQYGAYAVKIGGTEYTSSTTTYVYNTTNLSGTVEVIVYALTADGNAYSESTYTYYVKFNVAEAETGNLLLTIYIDGATPTGFSSSVNTYYIQYDRSETSAEITNLTASTGAKIEMNDVEISSSSVSKTYNLVTGGYKDIQIVVTSESSVSNTYHFYLIAADTTNVISSIKLLTSSTSSTALADVDSSSAIVNYSASTYDYAGTIAYSTKTAYLKVTASNANQAVYVNDSKVSLTSLSYGAVQEFDYDTSHTSTITVYSLSEYGYILSQLNPSLSLTDYTVGTYTITITIKDPVTDATLAELYVTLPNGTVEPFTVSNYTDTDGKFIAGTESSSYTIANVGNISYVEITAVPTDTSLTPTGDVGTFTMNATTSEDSTTNYTFVATITVTAENGNSEVYTITISRGAIDLGEDNTIINIDLADSNSIMYVGASTNATVAVFSSSVSSYSGITIPYSAQAISFEITTPTGSSSTIKLKSGSSTAETLSSGSKTITITTAMRGTTVTYVAYAVSQSGTTGTQYSFKVTFSAGSANSAITLLTYNGTTVPGFSYDALSTTSDNQMEYTVTISVTYDVSYAEIAAIADDENATLSGTLGRVNLSVGSNKIIVICTPQDGSTASNYIFYITRYAESPYIFSIELTNGTLYNATNGSTTEFDQGVYTYTIRLKYAYSAETIITTLDNTAFSVTGTNSTQTTNSTLVSSFVSNTVSAGGSLTVVITASSTTGGTQPYTFVIRRASEESTDSTVSTLAIAGLDSTGTIVETFEEFSYEADTITYGTYYVSNIVTDLDVSAVAAQAGSGATVQVYNNEDLEDGDNTVLVVCTSEDGSTTTVYIINVNRANMEWDVDCEASGYTTTAEKEKVSYTVELGTADATTIDWIDYIVYDSTQNAIAVEVVSDVQPDSNQVVLKISDGSAVEYVTMNLTYSTSLLESVGNSWWIWVIVIADVILLTAILISVNRDKYGSVTKKRKEE